MYPEKTVLQMDRQMDRAEFIGTSGRSGCLKSNYQRHFLSN